MNTIPTRNDILSAFAVEMDHDAQILNYLLAYPKHSDAISLPTGPGMDRAGLGGV